MKIITRTDIPDPYWLHHKKFSRYKKLSNVSVILAIIAIVSVALIHWITFALIIGIYAFIFIHEGMHLAAASILKWKRKFFMLRILGAAVNVELEGVWSHKKLKQFLAILMAPLIAVIPTAMFFSLIVADVWTWTFVLALGSVGDAIAAVKTTLDVRKCKTPNDLRKLDNKDKYRTSRTYYFSVPKIVVTLRDWDGEPPFYPWKLSRKKKRKVVPITV